MELLGAEPLKLLIGEHVLQNLEQPYRDNPWATPFDYFRDTHDKYLLATATNISEGAARIFGDEAQEDKPCNARLVEALLASSAFPAVFRPRRFSEVSPSERDILRNGNTLYVDGGLMDNLPLDHVITFLHERARRGLVARRPKGGTVPHLLLTASLEPKAEPVDALEAKNIRNNWPSVNRRVTELHYNRKIHMFEKAQDDFRKIIAAGVVPSNPSWKPLDMKVVTVIPKWLCGTFAFHGMLGFRYYKQAASIAHGCAMTFGKLDALQKEPYGNGYKMNVHCHGNAFSQGEINSDFLMKSMRDGKKVKPGTCWFRPESCCPFSPEAIQMANARAHAAHQPLPFLEETARVLPMIYEYCGRPETHERLC